VSTEPQSAAAVHAAGIAAAIALSVAAWLLAAAPMLRSRDASMTTVQRIAQRDRQLREAAVAKADSRRLLAKLESELARAVQLKPVSGLNQRLAAISAACDRLGLVVDQLTPAAPEASKRYVAVRVRLAGSATYAQSVALVETLARDFPDTAVTGFVLKGDPTRPGDRSVCAFDLVWHAAPAGFAGAPTTP